MRFTRLRRSTEETGGVATPFTLGQLCIYHPISAFVSCTEELSVDIADRYENGYAQVIKI